MADFHVRLVLEYFQARARTERTTATLVGIVDHVCTTYALTPEASAQVQAEALAEVQRRGLVHP